MNPCDRGFRIAFLFYIVLPFLLVGCLQSGRAPLESGEIRYYDTIGGIIEVKAPQNQKTPAAFSYKMTKDGSTIKVSTGDSEIVASKGILDFLEGTGPMQLGSVAMVIFALVSFGFPKVFARSFSFTTLLASLGVSAYAVFMDHPVFMTITFVAIVSLGAIGYIAYKKGKDKGILTNDQTKPV